MNNNILDTIIKISEKTSADIVSDKYLSEVAELVSINLNANSGFVMFADNGSIDKIIYAADKSLSISNIDKELIDRVIQTGSVFSNKDSNAEYIIYPLKYGKVIAGVFVIEGSLFNDEAKELIKFAVSQCVLVLERESIYKKLRSSENLQAIGLLKSSVAHDISNILGIADVYLSLIEEESGNNTGIADYVKAVKNEMKRISVLTTDMLDLSKDKITLHKELFYVSELLDDLRQYGDAFSKDGSISIDIRLRDNIQINADKNRLFRVFFNLMKNSSDALVNGGKIILTGKQAGDSYLFGVYDNGKGISVDDIGKLFQPFYTSGKERGTGLGLAVVKEIVEAHGGSIRVRSRSNDGSYTFFQIKVPVYG